MKFIWLPFTFILFSIVSFAQITTEWSKRAGTTAGDAIDFPSYSVSDPSGNTYISGFTTKVEANAGHQLFLKKLNNAGQIVWQKEFDTKPDFNSDSYSRMVLDNDNHIIVSIPDYYNGGGLNIIKVTADGQTLWSILHDPTTPYILCNLKVNSSNEIIIGASTADFVVLKFSSNGNLIFNQTIDGGLNIGDRMMNISLDNSDNILFSGNRGSIPGDNCGIVYKLNNSGTTIWSTVITHSNTSQIEVKDHILLNNEIIVCGYFFNTTDLYRGYLTKLNSTTGSQGTVFVDPQVSTAYYLLAPINNDVIVGVSDAQTFGGVSTSLKRFTNAFAQVWSQNTPISGYIYQLLTHQNTAIYALIEHGSSSNIKNTIYKYSSSGNLIWNIENDSSTYLSRSQFITISSTGSVRFTAPFRNNPGNYNVYLNANVFDFANNSGQVNWHQNLDGTVFSEDKATLNTKDSQGNIYVAGPFSAGWTNNAVGIVKYDAAGNLLWQKKLDFSIGTSKHDEPLSITCDALDNLIVAGFTTNSNKDFLLLKFNSNGDLLWQKIFNGTGNNIDQFSSVVTDNNNNIYVGGLSVRNFGGNNNYYVHQIYKYAPDGTQLWENWDYSTTNGNQKLMLSPSQQMLYVACEYYGNSTNPSDIGVFKLRADNGSYLHWAKYSGSSNNSNDKMKGIAIDSNENIYLCGDANNSGMKIVLIKYDSTLASQWVNVNTVNGTANQLYQDFNENLIVTASSMTTDSMALIKYNKNGTIIWKKKLISNLNNLSGHWISQVNDTAYVIASQFNTPNFSFRLRVTAIDTASQFLFNNANESDTTSLFLRQMIVSGNNIYLCGFYTEMYTQSIFHFNYYLNKYNINFNGNTNQPPVLTSIQDILACTIDAPLQLPFTINDENANEVNVTATSSNQSVLDNASLSIIGSGSNRILAISFVGSNAGNTVLTLSATDNQGLISSANFNVQIDLCTTVDMLSTQNIQVYPNPASQYIYITGINSNENITANIISMNGTVLLSSSLFTNHNMLSTENLPSGSYKLVLSTATGILKEYRIQVLKIDYGF